MWQQEHEAAGHIAIRKQIMMKAWTQLPFYFILFFYEIQNPSLWDSEAHNLGGSSDFY